jgi:hypothetical protein
MMLIDLAGDGTVTETILLIAEDAGISPQEARAIGKGRPRDEKASDFGLTEPDV